MTELETNKELENAVRFCMKRIMPELNSRFVNNEHDEDILVNSLNVIKQKSEPVMLEHILHGAGLEKTVHYKQKVGTMLAKHAYTGYLGIDRSGLVRLNGSGHYPSEFVWDADYAQKLERKYRNMLDFDKHAKVLLNNQTDTINTFTHMILSYRNDFERAEAVFHVIKEIIEVNGVGNYAVPRSDYLNKRMPAWMKK